MDTFYTHFFAILTTNEPFLCGALMNSFDKEKGGFDRDNHEKREFRGQRDTRDSRDSRDNRDNRDSRENRDNRDTREKGGFSRDKKGPRRPSLREVIMDLDRDILKLLARRCNILDRMRGHRGQLDSREEKELRAAWEISAGKMSRDPRLTRQIFSLFQEIEFLDRPMPGEERRPAFNLAPAQRPIALRMTAPLACRRSRLYLTLSAVAGAACRLAPSLLNDQTVECIKMFNQAGTSLAWDEDGTLRSREGGGITLADKVIYVGEDLLNFYLILGQYVGHMSRAKFTAESSLKLADVSAMRRFLPQIGARLSNAVPRSDGLPVRIECSGLVPDVITFPAELPADAIIGLLMAAPFWEKPVTMLLAEHPEKDAIIDEAVSILQDCKADVLVQDGNIRIVPCTEDTPLHVPAEPALGMDVTFAANLLALPAGGDGHVSLTGRWPSCAVATQLEALLQAAGVETKILATGIQSRRVGQGVDGPLDAANLPLRFAPLALALAAIPALRGKSGHMPKLPADVDLELIDSFLTHIGLEASSSGALSKARQPEAPAPAAPAPAAAVPTEASAPAANPEDLTAAPTGDSPQEGDNTATSATDASAAAPVPAAAASAPPAYVSRHPDAHIGPVTWTAPTPEWALALALCAFGRPGLKLANPGIMTGLYPVFWTLYNGLPNPDFKKVVNTEPVDEKPVRRRIIAGHNPAIDAGDSDN